MGWGFVGRGFVGQPRIPDNLCTPRSHADGDLDLKLILLVFTSPGYDLLLHIYLKNKPLYFGFLWLCGQGTDAYLDISGSPKFSTHYLLWEVCGTPVFCQATAPFLSFHTRRDHMGALKAFCLKTDVRTYPCLRRQAAFPHTSFVASEDVQSQANIGRIWAAAEIQNFMRL